jgi:hypothetical protein
MKDCPLRVVQLFRMFTWILKTTKTKYSFFKLLSLIYFNRTRKGGSSVTWAEIHFLPRILDMSLFCLSTLNFTSSVFVFTLQKI